MFGSRLRPYLGPVIALLVVLALGAGTVYAAIPNGDGKYYACYVKNTGAVKLINYPKVKTCPKGEKLIDWNAKGPAGPAGAQGAQGAQGPAGPADWNAIPNIPADFKDGVDNVGVMRVKLTRVNSSQVSVSAGLTEEANATCPAGSSVTGGGFFASSTIDFNLGQSKPTDSGLTGWKVDGKNTGTGTVSITAHAICMSVEPAGAFATAKKGLLPASVKKAMKKRDR